MRHFVLSFLIIMLASCDGYTDKVAVVCKQPVLPVLTLKETNPVLKITMISPETVSLNSLKLSFEGTTDISDIEKVELYLADENGNFSDKVLYGSVAMPGKSISLNSEFRDTTIFWLSVKLKDSIDLLHHINVTCHEIATSFGMVNLSSMPKFEGLRTGVALRQHNQDGVHTTRIPGITKTKKGTLIAIYDARRDLNRDLQGDIDIALNRSFDGGRTWLPMQIALDMGEWGGLPQKYNGVSDACILTDETTGNIYIAGLWMHGVLDRETGKWVEGLTADSTRWLHQWQAKGSQPGFGVKETSQFLITKSTDDGLTWSEPINITTAKKQEWWLFAPAPGHGITLDDGTLVFPSQGRDKTGLPFSNITYSRDGGKTWTTSAPAYNNTTECMAAQLSDGSIMLNMRDNRNRGNSAENGRRICVTTDLGATWTEHPTSRSALIEPTCMAGLLKHVYIKDGQERSILLFSNPESCYTRDHITLKASYDDGMTWTSSVLLDEYSGRGYSCLTSVNDSVVGILYESSQADLIFQQVNISDLACKKHYLGLSDSKALHEFYRYKDGQMPVVQGHRGSIENGMPENCIETFEYVLSQMPAVFEIDPRLTKDSVIVVFHDATLERTSTGTGKVADHTYTELQQLRLKNAKGDVTYYRIPTLEEVLLWARGKTVLLLDKKDVPPGMIAEMIRSCDANSYVMNMVRSVEEAKFYFDENNERMFSALIRKPEDYQAYINAGIPKEQMFAAVRALIDEQTIELCRLMKENGLRCLVATASTSDKLKTPEERAAMYRKIIESGASMIESNYPIEVWRAIK